MLVLAAAGTPGEPSLIGSVQSDVYHRLTCASARRIVDRNVVHFETPEDAHAAGYRPCRRCLPPQPPD